MPVAREIGDDNSIITGAVEQDAAKRHGVGHDAVEEDDDVLALAGLDPMKWVLFKGRGAVDGAKGERSGLGR